MESKRELAAKGRVHWGGWLWRGVVAWGVRRLRIHAACCGPTELARRRHPRGIPEAYQRHTRGIPEANPEANPRGKPFFIKKYICFAPSAC